MRLSRVIDEEEFRKQHFSRTQNQKQRNLSSLMLKPLPNLKMNNKLFNTKKVNSDLKQYYRTKENMRNMKIEVLKMNGKPVQQILNETIGPTF